MRTCQCAHPSADIMSEYWDGACGACGRFIDLTAKSTFYIAPADDPRDEWRAGYEGNHFATRDEAEAEVPQIGRAHV